MLTAEIECTEIGGEPIFSVQGMEFACSEALNRLAPARVQEAIR